MKERKIKKNKRDWIYEDAMVLLLSDKTDIRAEILDQLQQGDACLEEYSTPTVI